MLTVLGMISQLLRLFQLQQPLLQQELQLVDWPSHWDGYAFWYQKTPPVYTLAEGRMSHAFAESLVLEGSMQWRYVLLVMKARSSLVAALVSVQEAAQMSHLTLDIW